jgi:hypothetical protein
VADKGLHRSRRMKGFPLEGYEPLPPNSPKDTFCGEVFEEENYSDTRSVVIPLIEHPEGTIVTVREGVVSFVNPPLTNPLDLLLVQVDSLGNSIPKDYPILLSRLSEEVNMESKQLNISEGYTTPAHTRMVDPSQTHVHPIWKTPLGHDIFEKFNLNRPFYAPPHTHVVTSVGT